MSRVNRVHPQTAPAPDLDGESTCARDCQGRFRLSHCRQRADLRIENIRPPGVRSSFEAIQIPEMSWARVPFRARMETDEAGTLLGPAFSERCTQTVSFSAMPGVRSTSLRSRCCSRLATTTASPSESSLAVSPTSSHTRAPEWLDIRRLRGDRHVQNPPRSVANLARPTCLMATRSQRLQTRQP
jgi:hypothetical protein